MNAEIEKVLSGESEGCILCGDSLEIMAGMPNGGVDCVVTDPPYGIGEARGKNKSRSKLAVSRDYGYSTWDDNPLNQATVDLLLSVSQNQVIFGGNYIANLLPPSPAWIVWDKDNGKTDFADCELAWTSYKKAVRKIKWRWQGFLQENMKEKDERVHPAQKPLGVMLWIVENYTKPNDVIFDAYMGSGTTCVAAKKLGRRWIGIDISEKYVEISKNRLQGTERPLFKD